MCKIAGVTKITKENQEDVWKFMVNLGDLMSVGNTDGLGYAAFDQDNNIFGEKWLVNRTSFTDFEATDKNYTSFGKDISYKGTKAIILHTRMATCARGIQNAHPHIDDLTNVNAALIHNGMIYNDQKFTKKHSTCDSEILVHEYMSHKVNEDLKNLNKFTDKLSGWFTCLVLTKDSTGRPVMDIFTDSSRLASAYISNLGTRVFSTHLMDIIKTCQIFKYDFSDVIDIKAETATRIDVETGEFIEAIKIPVYNYTNNYTKMTGNFEDDGDYWSYWFNRGN